MKHRRQDDIHCVDGASRDGVRTVQPRVRLTDDLEMFHDIPTRLPPDYSARQPHRTRIPQLAQRARSEPCVVKPMVLEVVCVTVAKLLREQSRARNREEIAMFKG